jgi:acetylornithine deacetylase/succinyl-diaminopimelate desuccinylase-like protein
MGPGAGLGAYIPPGARAPMATPNAVLEHLRRNEDAHLAELQDLVRIPSVSADPKRAADVRRAADWLMARLRKAGMENVRLVETSGLPAVVADWLHAGPSAPTLLVYGHYDVQPAAKTDGWQYEPFEARVADGRVWGRGTTDDKGQLMCHVFAAEAWLRTQRKLPVNLKMVFEGEEEMGSLHFKEVIDKAGEELRADLLIVSDSPMHGEGQPALTHSLRGLDYFQVDVEGPSKDLHSGTFGGILWNPNEALVHMLAACKDAKTGRVLIPGFYDDVVAPSKEERARLAKVAESESALKRQTGVAELFGEKGWTPYERIGVRPTFEINGIYGGYTGEGAKTVIPAHAHAKVSCRLVANQQPQKVARLVEKHLKSLAKPGTKVKVTVLSAGSGVRADPDHPLVRCVERALEETWGKKPVLIPEGGSIPPVADMQKRLGVVPILCGFGHRDENMHAPEESFRLASFFKGREACARMLAELAEAGRPTNGAAHAKATPKATAKATKSTPSGKAASGKAVKAKAR